jgi:hypothetical protein
MRCRLQVKDTLTAGNSMKDEAVRKAVALGMVSEENHPEDGRRKLLHFSAAKRWSDATALLRSKQSPHLFRID